MKLFIFIMVTLIILFFPVRIKLSVKFIDKDVSIKIFGKDLLLDKKGKTTKKDNRKKRGDILQLENINKILSKLSKGLLRPSIKLDMDVNYGLEDAAVTGLLYGLFQSVFSVLYNILNLYFKVKKFTPKVNPIFNKNIFNLELKGIITINLANIIYIKIATLKMFSKKVSSCNESRAHTDQ